MKSHRVPASRRGSVLVAALGLIFILFTIMVGDYIAILSQVSSSRAWDRRRQDRDARLSVRAALREAYYLKAETAPNRSQADLNACVEAIMSTMPAQHGYTFLPAAPSPDPFVHQQYPSVSAYTGLTRGFDANIEGAGALMPFLHGPAISAAHYLGTIPFQFEGRGGQETFNVRVWSVPLSQFAVTAYGMPSLGEAGVPSAPPSLSGYQESPNRPMSFGHRLLVTTSDQSEDSTVAAEFTREEAVLDQSYRVRASLAWNAYEWLWGEHYYDLIAHAGAARSFEPSRLDWADNPEFVGLTFDQATRTVTIDLALYPEDILRVGPAGDTPVTVNVSHTALAGVNAPLVLLLDNNGSSSAMAVRLTLSQNPPAILLARNASVEFLHATVHRISLFLDPESSVVPNPGRLASIAGSIAYYWQRSPFPGLNLRYAAIVASQDLLAQRSPRAIVVSAH